MLNYSVAELRYMMLYLFGSLALGLIAVLAGHYLAKIIA